MLPVGVQVLGVQDAVRDELREARRRAAEDLFAPLSAEERETLGTLLTRLDPEGDTHSDESGGASEGRSRPTSPVNR